MSRTSKKKENKKYIKWMLLAAVFLLAAGVAYGVWGRDNNSEDPDLPPIPKDVEVKVQKPEDYVEPGYGNLEIEEISGFNTVQSAKKPEEQIKLADPGLILEAVGKYSGPFIEDGSDEPMANCLSIIVTNDSAEMVQIADITLKVNDKDKANFKVTNLPAGASVMVLESNKRKYKEGDKFTYEDMQAAYLKDTSIMEDTFEIKGEDGKLTVKNISDKDYEKVYIYYKYTQRGGSFLGGITYRVPVENIKAGKTVEVVAGHWREGSSRLSMVDAIEK